MPSVGAQAAGQAGGRAELRSAGTLVTAPGGHGTEYGVRIPTISAPSEARAFVVPTLTVLGSVSGKRPGKQTELYFDYLLNRITVVGATYLVIICLIPEILFSQAGVPFYLGGTSLLIVVNVTMDTVSQIQSHLIAHQYGDLIKKAKLKGGRRR